MNDNDMITLRLSRRDVGRVQSVVRDRKRKAKRGLDKFAGNFDPVLGKSLSECFEAYSNLEANIEDQLG
jgi:hypothetical protein